jgi:hypothetical protein
MLPLQGYALVIRNFIPEKWSDDMRQEEKVQTSGRWNLKLNSIAADNQVVCGRKYSPLNM